MRIDDFICLGRTVPEESKKYGHKVCMAGYSEELRSLMRVYPLPVINPIHARHRCTLDLERNIQDSRAESWKLKDRDGTILSVSDKPVPVGDVVSFLQGRISASIEEMNARRASLGILEVGADCRGVFVGRSEVDHPDQGTLFDIADQCFGANAIDVVPYLQFYDRAGHPHRLQVREWGCYEWIRKHRGDASMLWQNLGIHDGRPSLLVVGNMANHRNTWLIIKVFKVASCEEFSLFGLINNEVAR